MRKRRRNPSLTDINTFLMWGAFAVLAYFIYKTFTGTKKVLIDAQQAAGSTVADAMQAILGSGQAKPGEVYEVTMPDGSVQTVPYGQLPTAPGAPAAPFPAMGPGMTIGTGNAILDSLTVGETGGG
jgi:hypothetical protein